MTELRGLMAILQNNAIKLDRSRSKVVVISNTYNNGEMHKVHK